MMRKIVSIKNFSRKHPEFRRKVMKHFLASLRRNRELYERLVR